LSSSLDFLGTDLKKNAEKWKTYFIEHNLKLDRLILSNEHDSDEIAISLVATTRSDDELESNECSSTPFVKIPLEDRSKYEKLACNTDEVSSDDSQVISGETRKKSSKRRKIPEFKSSANRFRKDKKNKKHQND